MSQILQYFILLPLFSFLLTLLLPKKNERLISGLALATIIVYLIGLTTFLVYWLSNGFAILDRKHIVFFKANDIEIFIDFYFDRITAVYAFIGAVITWLVIIFSRYYIHRDQGFKRFFATILLFFLGYNLVIFSGNFETLFMGWEILGICSFLLIAFYRDRYLPVKNGLKVISVFRLGDICLILIMWMSHQLWHSNITFIRLNDAAVVQQHLQQYGWYGIFICVMIVIAAATKSAQLPFSSWLPRAMEGPTTSSAIFYGSLSVHLGVFLLLRTYPYWESVMGVRVFIAIVGLSTALIAASIARVQSTVKTQIAYSSVTQIGLIFIEVALGLHVLALIHFAGNAFLRTYQLLVSPSVLSYLIHDMVFNFKKAKPGLQNAFMKKLANSAYILSIKEWNLDQLLYRNLWSPFKWLGNQMRHINSKIAIVLLILLFAFGIYAELNPENIPSTVHGYLPVLFSFLGLMLILKSFAERNSAEKAWISIIGAQIFITLSIAIFYDNFGYDQAFIYLSGALICSVGGYLCIRKLKGLEDTTDLNQFYGHAYEHPVLSFLFLLSCLGMVGFPFTPTFIGIDLLFSHINKTEIILIIFLALSFIFMELAVLRIYSRLFLGQHKKAYHPIAFRSS